MEIDAGAIAVTTTDEAGQYEFTGLTAGSYIVDVDETGYQIDVTRIEEMVGPRTKAIIRPFMPSGEGSTENSAPRALSHAQASSTSSTPTSSVRAIPACRTATGSR